MAQHQAQPIDPHLQIRLHTRSARQRKRRVRIVVARHQVLVPVQQGAGPPVPHREVAEIKHLIPWPHHRGLVGDYRLVHRGDNREMLPIQPPRPRVAKVRVRGEEGAHPLRTRGGRVR